MRTKLIKDLSKALSNFKKLDNVEIQMNQDMINLLEKGRYKIDTKHFRGNAVEELSSGRIYILDAGRIELFTLFHSLAVEVIPSTVREATND